jgi:hypothetical protein
VLGTPPALILSQDQTLKLNSFAPPCGGTELFNVDRLLIKLSNVVQFVKLWVVRCPAPLVNYTFDPGLSFPMQRHPLILDGRSSASHLAVLRRKNKCLHVLSSFQRTGCFSEPPDAFVVVRGTLQFY